MRSLLQPEADSTSSAGRVVRRPRASKLKVAESLERRLAFDLVGVLVAEVPDVDPIAVGLGIVEEARRRETQGRRAWGNDRPRGAA